MPNCRVGLAEAVGGVLDRSLLGRRARLEARLTRGRSCSRHRALVSLTRGALCVADEQEAR